MYSLTRRCQANIEEKQGRFQIDRYKAFAFHNGSTVYNPRDHNWIPNATDKPWANCTGKNQNTNITPSTH